MDKEKRELYTKTCLAYLSDYINKHPEMRFIQALWGCGLINREQRKITSNEIEITMPAIEDRFYEESEVTFQKLKRVLEDE